MLNTMCFMNVLKCNKSPKMWCKTLQALSRGSDARAIFRIRTGSYRCRRVGTCHLLGVAERWEYGCSSAWEVRRADPGSVMD